ncbi:MAG: hypothetical protein IPK59_04685 [Rhodospirillaceae bacterium]|nr:hypothetical protein [Rhodospirillaceae bacterium]
MLRWWIVAALSCLAAAPAVAEVDTLNCNSARAVYISYEVYALDEPAPIYVPGIGRKASGAACLLGGETLKIHVARIEVRVAMIGVTPSRSELVISHDASSAVFIGQTSFETSWISNQGFETGEGTDSRLVRNLSPETLGSTTLRIPLRERHRYDPVRDGNWQYVPLRVDYLGELVVRLGDPDIGRVEGGQGL